MSVHQRGVHLPAAPRDPVLHAALARWHAAGVSAVDPAATTHRAMRRDPPPATPHAILAVGKAAATMADGALSAFTQSGVTLGSGLVIVHDRMDCPTAMTLLLGDHPLPGKQSLAASEAVGEWISSLPPEMPVIVLLSGGASALIAAPLAGIAHEELGSAFEILHELGLDIVTMNAARRQLTRWSGGRLRTALGARAVVCYLISDVPSGELAAIGSGPLIGGKLAPAALRRDLLDDPAFTRFAPTVQRALVAPPPPSVTPTPHIVVASGATMLRDLSQQLDDHRLRVCELSGALIGTTTSGARQVSDAIATAMADPDWDVLAWAGELTVTLGAHHGSGGRCQQFAVELSLLLESAAGHSPRLWEIVALAAGTDGRDGPTDAAGAYATAHLPAQLRAAGFHPQQLVLNRDTHRALDRVGALYRTGRTGTNVADLILVSRPSALRRRSIPTDG